MLSGAKALFMVFLLDSKGAKACKSFRSRQELSNDCLIFEFGFDTAEPASQPRKGLSKFAIIKQKVRRTG